jgi:hypothetical protein
VLIEELARKELIARAPERGVAIRRLYPARAA